MSEGSFTPICPPGTYFYSGPHGEATLKVQIMLCRLGEIPVMLCGAGKIIYLHENETVPPIDWAEMYKYLPQSEWKDALLFPERMWTIK